MGRRFGIEEEFFLADPHTGRPVCLTPGQAADFLGLKGARMHAAPEFLACQIENSTEICNDRFQALQDVQDFRAALLAKAAAHGLVPLASATPALPPAGGACIGPGPRYAEIARHVPGLAREHLLSGMHVHVETGSKRQGVAALNALRAWLPLLAALAANSPFWQGRDTGFASWRTIQYRRWPTTGVPPFFADATAYQQYLTLLLSSDAVLDPGAVGWAARLSHRYPTVEVRVCDVQRTGQEAVVLALLIRAIVDTALAGPAAADGTGSDLLNLKLWQAAHAGVRGRCFDAVTGQNTGVASAVARLLDYAGKALQRTGDDGLVHQVVEGMLARGNGAVRQRQDWQAAGASGVAVRAAREFCGTPDWLMEPAC